MADGTRRMSFKSNLTTKFLVMVFGSQDGGGNAIVTQASLGRGGEPDVGGTNMEASAPVMTNEIFKTGHVWLDGEGIDPTATGFDGGWQIVSVKLAADANSNKGLAVKGLGARANESKDSGGQNYAEVLLFDQVLTDDQRRTVESYLARKWGLVGKYKGVLAADRHINAYGAGDIRLNGVAAQLGGVFSGTVTVGPDAELMMPDELKPAPTEEDVAKVGGRLGWYDPSQDGAIDYQKSSDYKSCVNVLRDRVNGRDDGTYVLVAGNGRSPSVEERTTEFGVTQRWLQFANVNPTSTNKYEGNALRMNLMPTLATGKDAPLSGVLTVMMVMDSSQGGGCPILESAISGGNLLRFGTSDMFCKDWSRPIWTTKAVNNYFGSGSETYLNGLAVDGSKQGFTGAPEVLTAVASKEFVYAGTGGYAYKDWAYVKDGDTNPHTDVGEIAGEILVFEKVLDDVDRQMIEAYLMRKWIGCYPVGAHYGSLDGLKVTGGLLLLLR